MPAHRPKAMKNRPTARKDQELINKIFGEGQKTACFMQFLASYCRGQVAVGSLRGCRQKKPKNVEKKTVLRQKSRKKKRKSLQALESIRSGVKLLKRLEIKSRYFVEQTDGSRDPESGRGRVNQGATCMSETDKRTRARTSPPRIESYRERGPEVVRPRRKPEGQKEKSPGFVVNKTAKIRKVASELVAQGKPPRPKVIKETLKAEGIEVSSAQVSMALTDTEFAYRRNKADWGRPQVVLPDPALAFGQVSIDDVLEARKFVERIGTVEKAMAALVALKQFGGGASKPSELIYRDSWADSPASQKASSESA